MHFAILLIVAFAVPAIRGAATNSTGTEVDVSMLPSTQQLMKDGCVCNLRSAPVCASDKETYGNDCLLACARKADPYLTGLCHGECPCCKKAYRNSLLLQLDGDDDVGDGEVRW